MNIILGLVVGRGINCIYSLLQDHLYLILDVFVNYLLLYTSIFVMAWQIKLVVISNVT